MPTTSALKLENVVSAPRNPVTSASRQCGQSVVGPEKHGDCHTDQVAADQVGRQRAPGQQRGGGVEPQAQAPARQRADAGPQADGDHLQHEASRL